MTELLYPEESHKLIGLAMQLHNELGCGFSEKVYQDAFEVLLNENQIPYEREKHSQIVYHGVILGHDYFYDFLCYGKIVVELKAHCDMLGEFESQVINYVHAGGYQLGLLLNFGATKLQYKCFPNRLEYHTSDIEK